MEAFLTKYASAIFALIGAVLGAGIAGLINYVSKTKETKLRLIEKLIDKKLEAYESLFDIIGLIRSSVLLGGEDERGELRRCPMIMYSQDNMDDFLLQYAKVGKKTIGGWLTQ